MTVPLPPSVAPQLLSSATLTLLFLLQHRDRETEGVRGCMAVQVGGQAWKAGNQEDGQEEVTLLRTG